MNSNHHRYLDSKKEVGLGIEFCPTKNFKSLERLEIRPIILSVSQFLYFPPLNCSDLFNQFSPTNEYKWRSPISRKKMSGPSIAKWAQNGPKGVLLHFLDFGTLDFFDFVYYDRQQQWYLTGTGCFCTQENGSKWGPFWTCLQNIFVSKLIFLR